MATTTPLGFRIPSADGSDQKAELEEWFRNLGLDIDTYLSSGWTSYTPALTGSVSNPNLGTTGTAVGAYSTRGKTVTWRVYFIAGGTGVSAGSGQINVSLPVTPVSTVWQTCGGGWVYNGAFSNCSADINAGTSTFRMIGAAGIITAASGGISALGHVIALNGTYQAA